jgi:hypothetical protein
MINVIYDYRERVAQIEKYLNFLLILDNVADLGDLSRLKSKKIVIPNTEEFFIAQLLNNENTFKIEGELIKILKSNTILLLYNLIEGTISAVLNEFFGTINNEGLKYSDYQKEIKQIWIKYKHRSFSVSEKKEIAYIVNTIDDIFSDIVEIVPKTVKDNEVGTRLVYNYEAYTSETMSNEISGNLDARKIKEIFNIYGLPGIQRRCDPMLKVKNKRNSLAHGNETFAQVGGALTVQELVVMKGEIKTFLDLLLEETKVYLHNKNYLLTPRTTIAPRENRSWWEKIFDFK